MATTVYFRKSRYGNYLDHYYTDNYAGLIATLQAQSGLTWSGNLGIIDGIMISNKFSGDFTDYNCAIVVHETYGTHLYKITSKKFLRRGLWMVSLEKDIISANWLAVLSSKVLSERLGISRSTFRPILYQQEPMTLSEVKQNSISLNEKFTEEISTSNIGKTYGFLLFWTRDSLVGNDVSWSSGQYPSYPYDITVATLSALPIHGHTLITSRQRVLSSYRVPSGSLPNWSAGTQIGKYTTNLGTGVGRTYSMVVNDNGTDTQSAYYDHSVIQTSTYEESNINVPTIPSVSDDTLMFARIKTWLNSKTLGGDYLPTASSYDGKVVYESTTGKYYECRMSTSVHTEQAVSMTTAEAIVVANNASAVVSSTKPTSCTIIQDSVTYTFDELPVYENIITHTFSLYKPTQDQPFKIMWVPHFEGKQVLAGQDEQLNTNYNLTVKLLTDLISNYGGESAKLLDVQVAPYSPIDGFADWWSNDDGLFIPPAAQVKDEIILGDSVIQFFEVVYSSFTKNIPVAISLGDYKVRDKYKYVFTSPSGANNWDFSVAKNGGLSNVIVNADLRPYASYYQIKPIFSGLYGINEVDTRGLIWQEDSSITQITSAWETYKRQNVNYQQAFNSDIEYSKSAMGITHDTNKGNYMYDSTKHMIVAGVQAATLIADTVADDLTGAKGAIAGGIGAAAIIGGQLGMEAIEGSQMLYNNNQDLKRLELDMGYKRQQFNYSLDNIRALPQNTAKVSGIFNSNNMVPYIQVFGPTTDEINYLEAYLDEFGISVGMMVELMQYSSELYFLQGTLIRYYAAITNEEYAQMNRALTFGVRKYE